MTDMCPILWNDFAIDSLGNVFSCCHMKPPVLGNIYDTPMKELVNSPNVLERRRESLRGQLKCFSDCNLITYEKQPIKPINEYADYSNMTYLHLNFGHFCNIHCIMCKIHLHRKNNKSILDPETLIKNIDLAPFKEIVLQGGEPLFIPECREYLEYLGQIRKKYVMLTNGILIDNETAVQLARDAARVVISINAASKEVHEYVNKGSDFERVKDNIQRMRTARDVEHTELVLHGRMTLTIHALHEIPMFIQSYKEIGFDKINFGYDHATVPEYLKKNPDFKKKLAQETQNALKHAELSDINPLRLEQLGLIPEGFSGEQRGF
jgi:sulfatase maturation enzyme AslB (radical SAM superfamily)